MTPKASFNRFPVYRHDADVNDCRVGWLAIADRLSEAASTRREQGRVILAIDCYQGVREDEVGDVLGRFLLPTEIVRTPEAFRSESAIRAMVADDLTDDPVFGRLTRLELADYFDPERLVRLRTRIQSVESGLVLVVGPGAGALVSPDFLVFADMARWEIQQRMRRSEISNLGVSNAADSVSLQYKWGYFIDWRVLDRHKRSLFDEWDFMLDTNDPAAPKLLEASTYLDALEALSRRPFMLKPFFDPGPWGGHWMEEVCDLDRTAPNYAWCFNCVPEENSLLIRIGDTTFETPALNLIFRHPDQVLGPGVHQRFGAEFPIRFDFLDTMGGGNLSLQVHPTKQYIQQQFGIPYTQDESYYLMAAEPGAKVYLGLRDHVDPGRMREALEHAQEGKASFPADDFAASFPVRKHDHVSIPAGTLHCSGKDAVVLEISATPYIFTFKLWDWGRMGLDGKPRPIHLDHGMNVLASDRTESWVRENLLSLVEDVGSGIGWREQRTGLHALEFIETRRHWFTGPVPHNTYGTVNVLTLVEGESIVVESPGGTFDPLVMRYAETIVVPASVGPYVIRPQHSSPLSELATLKAYVRDSVHGIYGS